jgi:predicted dehydrogenase
MHDPAAGRLTSAIVGCGRIGVADSARLVGRAHPSMLPVSHAECMIAGGALDLIALCDERIDKAREASIAYGVRSYFADVTTMLRAEVPAVVSVATRTRERPSVVQTLAEHGVRGIYAEKPFSRSLGECTLAIGAVDAAGAKLVLGTPRRYMRLYRRAHEIVASGQLGALTQVRIQLARGSTLLWSVPHSVDLLAYFSGARDVAYVQANCHIPAEAVAGDLIDCDPVVEAVTILFKNDVIGTLHAGIRFGVTLVC